MSDQPTSTGGGSTLPKPASSARQPSGARRPFSFADAVSVLQGTFKSSPTTSSAAPSATRAAASPSLIVEPQFVEPEAFPSLTPEQLKAFFPSESARVAVRAFLEEHTLLWQLDPQSLGSRTEENRGAAAIVAALASARVAGQYGGAAGSARAGAGGGAAGEERGSSESNAAPAAGDAEHGVSAKPFVRNWETHDLLRAIDNKDMETILRIRDANFDLLLDLQGGVGSTAAGAGGAAATPLGYCISLGPAHEGIAVVLVGALSKFVNQLPDDDDESWASVAPAGETRRRRARKMELDPRTQSRLRKLRVSLKLAIDHSLFKDQTRLVSSYCQVLFMSEGQPFILDSVAAASRALLPHGTDLPPSPGSVARAAVERFITSALRTRSSGSTSRTERIAAVDDLMANAAGDVLLMALWDLIRLRKSEVEKLTESEDEPDAETLDLSNPLPTYFFARDDRVASTYLARIEGLLRALEKLEHLGGQAKRDRKALRLAKDTAKALDEGTRRVGSVERLQRIEAALAKAA